MSQLNEAIFRRWAVEVWQEGNEAAIDELYDEHGVAIYPHGLENKPLYGIDEYKQFVRFVRRMFYSIELRIEQIASDDEKVVSYCTFIGRPKPSADEFFAGRSEVSVSGLCQIVVQNGKIAQAWSNVDLFGLKRLSEE